MFIDRIALLMAIGMTLLAWPMHSTAHASGDLPPQIEKTFDYGTLVEHTVGIQRGIYRISMRLSQRRAAEGSPSMVAAHLTFYPDSAPGAPPLTAPVFESLLTDMLNALNARFGNDLKLTSLSAGGFLGIASVEKGAILAMHGYPPWERYLDQPDAIGQPGIYGLIKTRWQSAGIFAPIMGTFDRLGYSATFSGFEKLFVFPAKKCSFYSDLEALGIRPEDRFPYPGVVTFSLAPK